MLRCRPGILGKIRITYSARSFGAKDSRSMSIDSPRSGPSNEPLREPVALILQALQAIRLLPGIPGQHVYNKNYNERLTYTLSMLFTLLQQELLVATTFGMVLSWVTLN